MRRHVILTLGRSGSNTLTNLINQNPYVLNIGEVLGDWNRVRQIRDKAGLYKDNTSAYLDALTKPSGLLRGMNLGRSVGRLIERKRSEIKSFSNLKTLGFKEFATLMSQEGQKDWLLDRGDVKVIGLVRDDVVGRLVSWLMLDMTGVVSTSSDEAKKTKLLTVDPERIYDLTKTVADENALLSEMLDALPSERVFRIDYADFYRNEDTRTEITRDVFEFLEVPTFETEVRMKKIISKPPKDVIENRDACAEALRGTEFEGILD